MIHRVQSQLGLNTASSAVCAIFSFAERWLDSSAAYKCAETTKADISSRGVAGGAQSAPALTPATDPNLTPALDLTPLQQFEKEEREGYKVDLKNSEVTDVVMKECAEGRHGQCPRSVDFDKPRQGASGRLSMGEFCICECHDKD